MRATDWNAGGLRRLRHGLLAGLCAYLFWDSDYQWLLPYLTLLNTCSSNCCDCVLNCGDGRQVSGDGVTSVAAE